MMREQGHGGVALENIGGNGRGRKRRGRQENWIIAVWQKAVLETVRTAGLGTLLS